MNFPGLFTYVLFIQMRSSWFIVLCFNCKLNCTQYLLNVSMIFEIENSVSRPIHFQVIHSLNDSNLSFTINFNFTTIKLIKHPSKIGCFFLLNIQFWKRIPKNDDKCKINTFKQVLSSVELQVGPKAFQYRKI